MVGIFNEFDKKTFNENPKKVLLIVKKGKIPFSPLFQVSW